LYKFSFSSPHPAWQLKYGEHISVEKHELVIFPVETAHRWSALVFQPHTSGLYSVDSGRKKIFAHSDLQYARYIAALEVILKVDHGTITRNPFRLPVAIQPNSHNWLCGYHVIANSARSSWPDRCSPLPSEYPRCWSRQVQWQR
jgi:hypothetical protein